jgi:steroid 5-alpha reductase family enzyme
MNLITLLLVLVVVGVVLWAINRFVPMQGQIKSIMNILVVLFVVVWLLQSLGVVHYLSHVHVG